MQPNIDYRLFDIVNVNLIHRNNFFNLVRYPKEIKRKFLDGSAAPLFYKMRPAIIIRKFINLNNKKKTWYLVIPLTSKNSAQYWEGAMNAIRVPFMHKLFPYKVSYLMLDHMQCMDSNQINNLYSNPKGRTINLTSGQRSYLKYNINNKLGQIVE